MRRRWELGILGLEKINSPSQQELLGSPSRPLICLRSLHCRPSPCQIELLHTVVRHAPVVARCSGFSRRQLRPAQSSDRYRECCCLSR